MFQWDFLLRVVFRSAKVRQDATFASQQATLDVRGYEGVGDSHETSRDSSQGRR